MTQDELLQVIDEAARTGATELDLAGLTDLLKDMNTLTAEIHTESGFAENYSTIRLSW